MPLAAGMVNYNTSLTNSGNLMYFFLVYYYQMACHKHEYRIMVPLVRISFDCFSGEGSSSKKNERIIMLHRKVTCKDTLSSHRASLKAAHRLAEMKSLALLSPLVTLSTSIGGPLACYNTSDILLMLSKC